MSEFKIPKTTQSEFDDLQSPLELDLMAVFKLIEDSVYGILDEDKTPEEMIKAVDKLFEE